MSLGLALGTPGDLTVSELMGRADQAMMQSKARGGNEISVFTAGMHRRNGIRTDIELHLGTAIRNGSLTLHYQPEVDLVTGSILGVEALVRWPHPTLGLLQPNAFIDIVEATNLAGELGRWVIETGCRQLTEWHQDAPGAPTQRQRLAGSTDHPGLRVLGRPDPARPATSSHDTSPWRSPSRP